MSKIAIIGATGRAGSQLLEEALRRGHSVTAIARDPSKLQGRERVKSVALDVSDAAALEQAVAGHDVVLSAAHFSSIKPQAIIEPVKRAGIKRLLVVGGAGSLLLPSGHKVIDSPDFPEAYKAEATAGGHYLDTLRQEQEQEQELDWSFLSPSAEFVEGARSGAYKLGKDHLLIGADGKSWISFADYAIAMLDEVEKPAHSRQRFTVGY
ncbi:NAD(P)-dependent oxidoreductase [Pseudomonas sp. BIGb0427]|uniref:NAD(P)-dependent oxidoreductase n=1 Tax=Pseudomonas sp. BIGb0427 TaxID=2724470 RepID=UPI00169BAAF6|nr:NAD(P)-dependent oxidoreductase [Pseudomonas sp. BIGb0427]NLU58708.1 NAD(P)-dependent oxidoreductase [Pseudomonas sp. BIGb0427]QPG63468.1 NAD(P)-dependent oxidoreductase [Pseudomonas sp. BIGb0427]